MDAGNYLNEGTLRAGALGTSPASYSRACCCITSISNTRSLTQSMLAMHAWLMNGYC